MTVRQDTLSAVASRLLERVRRALERLGPVRADDLILVAVSGGPDSVALLSLLNRIAPVVGWRLHAAHFDHGLRGDESVADARYVERLTESLRVPLTVGHAEPGRIVSRGRGLQAAAREARYAFFERVAEETRARWVATAHTADDQAETVLMRLTRGAGSTGLGGIPEARGRVLRPLLGTSRAEIETYLLAEGVTPRRDASNDNPRFARVAVRRTVLPTLRALNPRVVETLGRTATLLADDNEYLDARAEERLVGLASGGGGTWVELARAGLADLPLALRRRVLRRAVLRAGGTAEVSFDAVERLSDRVTSRATGRVMLGRGVVADLSGDRLRLERAFAAERIQPQPVVLPRAGTTKLPEWGLVVTVDSEAAANDGPSRRGEARFDSDRVPGILAVRARRSGDLFHPEGMRGRKRLQDFLVDERVPRWRRDQVPLLVAGSEILWVIGMRRDRRYLARDASRSVVKVAVQVIAQPV